MEYEIYTVTKDDNRVHVGEKRVKIKIPNSDKILDFCIDKDKNGKEFFHVPNFKNHPEKGILNTLFTGRIKDAIETIRDGDGDCILVTNIFGTSTSVVKFLDEEYGNDLRLKSIEGFEDTKFGYAVKVGFFNAMSGGSLICKDNLMQSPFKKEQVSVKTFDDEEEVNAYIKSYEKPATQYAKLFCELCEKDWKNNANIYFMTDIIMNTVEDDTMLYMAFNIACNELDSNCSKAYIEVVQVIKE